MDNESTKLAMLMEAAEHGNQIYKLKNETGDFVKLKRSYSQPEELRSDYLVALSSLLNSGLVRHIFTANDIDLYELTDQGKAFITLASAVEQIRIELKENGRVYKIHSEKGEFVQCGAQSWNKIDSERIVYLQALHKLLHHGEVRVAIESKEMATYELDLTNQLYCDQHGKPKLDPDKFAA